MRTYLSVLVVAAATLILYLYSVLWLRPVQLQRALRTQGIRGPEPSFLFGNIRDMKDLNRKKFRGEKETVRQCMTSPLLSFHSLIAGERFMVIIPQPV